jgi:hypothetical protein
MAFKGLLGCVNQWLPTFSESQDGATAVRFPWPCTASLKLNKTNIMINYINNITTVMGPWISSIYSDNSEFKCCFNKILKQNSIPPSHFYSLFILHLTISSISKSRLFMAHSFEYFQNGVISISYLPIACYMSLKSIFHYPNLIPSFVRVNIKAFLSAFFSGTLDLYCILLAYFPEVGLCDLPPLCVRVSLYQFLNGWNSLYETRNVYHGNAPISMAYFMSSFHQSVWLCVYPSYRC